LIAKISSTSWHQALFNSKILKAELLLTLELLNDAAPLINEIKQSLYSGLTLPEQSRVLIAELNFYSKRHLQEKVILLRRKLDLHGNLLKTVDDMKNVGEVYKSIGYSYADSDDLKLAIQYFKKAYTAFVNIDENNNSVAVAGILSALGLVCIEKSEIAAAIKYFEQALSIYKINGSKFNQSVVLHNIGEAYANSEDAERGILPLQQSIKLSEQLNDEMGVMWSKQQLGDIALKTEDWALALSLFNETLPGFIKANDTFHSYSAIKGKAHAYLALGNIQSARVELEAATKLKNELNLSDIEVPHNLLEAKILYAAGDVKTSNTILFDTIALQQRVYKQEEERLATKYRIEFESEFQENKNKALTMKNKINAEEIKLKEQQNKMWVVVSVAFACCLLVCTFLLIQQIRMRKHFAIMSLSDSLTNQPNRRSVISFAKQAFEVSLKAKQPFTVVILDLDLFKKINDQFGHDVGDSVLKVFGKGCKDVIRKYDSFGRYGGEEWMLILTSIDNTTLEAIFKRLHGKVNKPSIKGLPEDYIINFSMGAATMTPDTKEDLSKIMKAADEQLYEAKENGRNQLKSIML
jgi:diguanylate cyclase (GGDEF)-like protein